MSLFTANFTIIKNIYLYNISMYRTFKTQKVHIILIVKTVFRKLSKLLLAPILSLLRSKLTKTFLHIYLNTYTCTCMYTYIMHKIHSSTISNNIQEIKKLQKHTTIVFNGAKNNFRLNRVII